MVKHVWDDPANWLATGKGDLSEHIQMHCAPDGGFVNFTNTYKRTNANNSKRPGHTAAMIILDPPYLGATTLDLTEIAEMIKACSWWAVEGCVMIVFIDWQLATPWCDALRKAKWVVEKAQLTVIRRCSR
jgi:hypothetical protein